MTARSSSVRVLRASGTSAATVVIRVSVAATAAVMAVLAIVSVIAPSAAHARRVWAMPLSVPSVMPSNMPRLRCASWPSRLMAKP